MKRLIVSLGAAVMLAAGLGAFAQDAPEGSPAPAPAATPTPPPAAAKPAVQVGKSPKKPVTLRGEILDLGCYLARGLRGPLHRDCAFKCIASGVPMGLLTADSLVYLLTQDHGRAMAPSTFTTPNPFEQCKQWPSQIVEVSGQGFERGGVKIVEVSRASLVPAATPGASP
jgi:hypothetical protein